MAWVAPPPDVQRAVQTHLGDTVWLELQRNFQKLQALDSRLQRTREEGGGLTQWYRSPEQAVAEFRKNPDAALYSQHVLGLAVDVTPSAAMRQRVIEEAKRLGFHVGTYKSGPKLHISALTPTAWARSPLQSLVRSLVTPILARRE